MISTPAHPGPTRQRWTAGRRLGGFRRPAFPRWCGSGTLDEVAHPWILVVVSSGLAVLAGACGPSLFACESDGACRRGDERGVCQPDGWCSFPDGDCASGQRYGEHAGGGLAGSCVPEEVGESTGASTVADGPASQTTDATSSDATGVSSTVSTTADDDPMSETEDTTIGNEGTDTGDDPLPCVFTEEFEGDTLDTDVWIAWAMGNTSIQVANGLLEFVLPPGGGNANVSTKVGNLEAMAVTVTLGHVAPSGSMIEQDFMLEDGTVSLRFSVRGGGVLLATWDGTWNPLPTRPTTAVSGDRLRFVHQNGELVAEHANGDAWEEVWSGPPPIMLDDVELRLRALGPGHPGGHPSFASVSVCPLP
jgi:hypothetical protein